MFNCKPGDIAVITWDEALVFSNVGKLVRVDGPSGYDSHYGLTWLITPVDYACGHLFIDLWDDGVVKRSIPGTICVRHPDEWMLPLKDTDNSCEEFIQEIITEAGQIMRDKEVITEACD